MESMESMSKQELRSLLKKKMSTPDPRKRFYNRPWFRRTIGIIVILTLVYVLYALTSSR